MKQMNILFVEPPKDFWFVMGEYLPPPLGILQLASFLELKSPELNIDVLDCQAQGVDWRQLMDKIESYSPDAVICSALSTCNVYTVIRTVDMVKKIDQNIKTIVGGQHFTALPQESLENYPEIDFIVRGEGELTLWELVKNLAQEKDPRLVKGISFKYDNKIIHNPNRPLITNLDDLPYPGYHFIEDYMHKYHFKMMADSGSGYALVEASRGCVHNCSFCSQWNFWGGQWRTKSPRRIADEMETLYNDYGISFLWLTDDNLGLSQRTSRVCDEIIKKGHEELSWFVQARSDDILTNHNILPKMYKAGNYWVLTGLERHDDKTINNFNKGINPSQSKLAMDLLKDNGIFAQATLITGDRSDSHESLSNLREYINQVNPDIAIFMVLTPFPGTSLYETAKIEGWIEDNNWNNYDMVHAVMSTEHLTSNEVQEELYQCYRDFYGSMKRRITGIFSQNKFKRQTYRYMASQGLLQGLRDLI
jgi:anaerobic magnesium-protoporphyrin IX monomethyl ester cyclase